MSRISVGLTAVALAVAGYFLNHAAAQQRLRAAGVTAVGTLGGDFSINANGAATYSIEMDVPPGTKGSAPELHVDYDSQSPNGLLGMGFTLRGVSAISRCAASVRLDGYIGGVSFDDRDRFCLDGQRLVKVAGAGGYGAPDSIYHTERETWTKIAARGACGSGPCSFEVWNKDGRKLNFGSDAQSRVPLPNRAEIAAWQIASTSDLNGNTVSVGYEFQAQTLQIRPKEIRYTSNAAANLSAGRFVRFEYEPRTDSVPRYVGGYLFQQDQRLKTIRTFVGAEAVLEFRLKYGSSAGTGQTLLKSIEKCAADGSCYPPTTFDWLAESNTLTSPNSNASGLLKTGWCTEEGASVGWIDFNGDGLPDVHCDTPKGTHRVLLSTGKELKSPNSSSDGTIRTNWCAGDMFHAGWIDFNGDGRGDLSCDGEDGSHRVLLSDGVAVKSPNSNADGLIKSDWCAGKTSRPSWGNFNADGRADLLCSKENGDLQALVSTSTSVTSPNSNPDGMLKTSWCSGAGAAAFWSDFNGDRLADVHCAKPDGTQQVLLSDGHTVRSPNTDPEGTVKTGWCAGETLHRGSTDFNGDGLVDSYCSSDDGKHWVLLSTGKMLVSPNSNSDGLLKTGWCAGGMSFWSDFNGDGLVDLTCSEPSGRQLVLISNGSSIKSPNSNADGLVKADWCKQTGEKPNRADFNGDGYEDFACHDASGGQYALIHAPGFPDLVSRITDGLGGVTEVTYASLTDQNIYTKGGASAFPMLDVITPMRVAVTQVTKDARGGSYRFDNHYTGARTDLESQAWLGFEKIRTTEAATGRATELTFLQAYPTTGYVAASRVYDKAKVLASSEFTPAVLNPYPNVHQVLNGTEKTSTYTNGKADFTNVKEYTYDKFGNSALVADSNPGDSAKSVFICYRYVNQEADWRLGYVEQNKVTATKAGCEAFLSGSPGWNPQTDLRWNKTEFDPAMNPKVDAQWDDRNNLWLATTRKFDPAGNAIEVSEPSGATTVFNLDPTMTYPLSEVSPELANGLKLTTRFRYSLKFGMIEALIDPNGNEQSQILDGFGRIAEIKGPDPSANSGNAVVTLKTVHYLKGSSGLYTETRERQTFEDADQAHWNWSRVYVDGLARQFRSEKRGEADNQVISVDSVYDTSGRLWKQSFPHFAGVTPAYTVTNYDLLNRPTRITTPNLVAETREYLRGELEVKVTTAAGTAEARATVETRDARANLVLMLDPDLRTSSAEYDPLSQPVKQIRANGAEATFDRDSVGRVVRTDDADTGVQTEQFDATGRLHEERDADGNTTTYHWDPIDRVLVRATKPGDGGAEESFHFGYDDGAAANGLGFLTSVSGPQYQEKYSYTRYGLVGAEKLSFDGIEYVDDATYDAQGRQHLRQLPDGSKLRTNYYISGALHSVDFQEHGQSGFKTYGTWTGYNALDQPGVLTHGNGLKTAYQYYPAAQGLSRLQSWALSKSDGGHLLSAAYEWDRNNEISRIERKKNGGPAVEEIFEHDHMGWLKSATGSWGHATYGYDPNGNVNKKNGVEFTYKPKSNLLVTASNGAAFEHDHNGNLIRKNAAGADWKFGYNGDGYMTSVSRNGQERARHLYDEGGNRLKRVDAQGRVSRYISEDFDVFESGGKLVVTRYIRGDGEAVAAVSVSETQASFRSAVARQTRRAAPALYNHSPCGGLSLYLAALWSSVVNPETVDRLYSFFPAFLALMALAISFGLLRMARFQTGYSRQHPWFTRVAPVVACAILATMTPIPARADLGAGDGYPTPGTLYFHGDQIQSSVLVTDETGAPKTQVAYDPYGSIDQKNSSGPNNFRPKFTSQEWDSDSDLYYYGARYYDPDLARFVQPDPGDDTVSPYVYGDDDPQDFTDPDGEQAEVIIIMIVIGAIVGAYSGGAAVNDTFNPLEWDWGSGRTLAGILAGAAIGAAGGAIGGVAAEAGPAVGIIGEILIGAGENAAYTALGGGSTKDIAEAAIFGAGLGAITGGLGAAGGRAGSRALRQGEEALSETGGAARSSRLAKRGTDVESALDAAASGASFCSSFPSGTLVATEGGMKPIESIAPGTRVLGQASDQSSPATFTATEVMTRTAPQLVRIVTASATVEATPEHQFWVPSRGWVPASDLKAGDQLLTASGSRLAVASVEVVARRAEVHNFEVGAAHTYFVSPAQILVHNPSKLKKCRLSKLPATKTATTARTKKIWADKLKALVAEFGDQDVRFFDPPTGRRLLDLEEYALTINNKKAIVSLSSFGKGSSRPQHFAFANKSYGGIIKNKSFGHKNPYPYRGKKIRFTWHHHPEKKTMALVPTGLHKKLGHEGSFKHLF